MTTDTYQLRALIAKWRGTHGSGFTSQGEFQAHLSTLRTCADELKAALASALPGAPSDDLPTLLDNLMRAAFDDGDRGREKFSGATMAARAAVLAHVRGASAPPSATAGVEWLRAELNASAAYAGDYIGDERVVLLAVAMRKIDKLAALAQQPAPQSAPAGVEWVLELADEYDTKGQHERAHYLRTFAEQSAAVDEAAAIRAFEEHFQASSDDPYFEGELELWLTAWRKALAAQQQPAGVDEAMVARFLAAFRDTPGDEAIDADETVARRWLTAAIAAQQRGGA